MRSRTQRSRRSEAPRTSPIRRCRADRSAIIVDGDRRVCFGARARQRRGRIIGEAAAQHSPQNCPDIVNDIADRWHGGRGRIDGDDIGSRLRAGVARRVGRRHREAMCPGAQRSRRGEAPRPGAIRRRRADRGAIVVDGDRRVSLGTGARQRRQGVVGHGAVQHRPQNQPDIVGDIADRRHGRRRRIDSNRVGSRLPTGIARGVSRRNAEAMRTCAQRRRRREAPGPGTVRRRRADRGAVVVDGDRGIRLGTGT